MSSLENDEYLKKCIREYDECLDNDIVKKYILYNELAESYYSHRDESPEYLALSEEYAKKNIEIMPKIIEEYNRKRDENDGKSVFQSKDCVLLFSKEEDNDECQSYPPSNWCYQNSIDRLRIIYTKSNRIADAIELCEYGSQLLEEAGLSHLTESLENAKEKLLKKL